MTISSEDGEPKVMAMLSSLNGPVDNETPIEEVRLTVPTTDDPTIPALTFRTWVLGVISCVLLAFVNNFFSYRNNALGVSTLLAMIVVLPIGNFMATVLPTREIPIPFTKTRFSLNPGPFNMKEHVLITIFASSGAMTAYAVSIINIVKAFYKRPMHPIVGLLLIITTQMLGYGWAGMFRKFLVDSPYMWWPGNLIAVTLFKTLHEKEERKRGGKSRRQVFALVFALSFGYYIIPGYFFPSLTCLSFLCWIAKDSVTLQQIGSGVYGLGIGSFALDWNTIVSFLGSPLATPGYAILNVLAGFFLVVYVINPILYWTNTFEAKKFPMFSSEIFDSQGQKYDVNKILNKEGFDINMTAYNSYSKINLGLSFAMTYGLSFATLAATFTHILIFHGKSIWGMWKKATFTVHNNFRDVHTRLIKQNYPVVPEWWFTTILVIMMALSIFVCEGFGKQLQLPWWGVLLACAIAFIFTLPIGIIEATTNQEIGLNVITEMIIGYLYPGRPLANVTFKTYGYISMSQALSFIGDLKLATYMKIPPRSMFVAQLASTLIGATTTFATSWWLLTSINHICDTSALPKGSPWTCPFDLVFYDASIIWGVVGPLRMFGSKGNYLQLNWFFLAGFVAPALVWYLSQKFPQKKWVKLINVPLILSAAQGMPPARTVNYIMWGAVGVFFNIYIYNKYREWWSRYNYVLSAALDAGVALMGVLLFLTLQSHGIYGPEWWGLKIDDHCTLAKCPTASGIIVEGCPIF